MEASEYEKDPNVMAYRLKQYGGRLRELEDWRRSVDTTLTNCHNDIGNLREDRDEDRAAIAAVATALDGVRKTLVAFALTIAGSAIVALFTVLAATGKLG